MKKTMFLRVLLILCIVITLVSYSSEDANQTETQSTIALRSYPQTAFEIELLDLVNEDRVSKGLNALKIINEISYLGSTHDDYMISKGAISHDNFQDRVASLQNELGAITVSENVASGFRTTTATLAAWNNSPSHKANLEGNHTHFGLAVKADENGKNYYTLLFIRK